MELFSALKCKNCHFCRSDTKTWDDMQEIHLKNNNLQNENVALTEEITRITY